MHCQHLLSTPSLVEPKKRSSSRQHCVVNQCIQIRFFLEFQVLLTWSVLRFQGLIPSIVQDWNSICELQIMNAKYFYLDQSFFKYEKTISVLHCHAAREAFGPLSSTISSLCAVTDTAFFFASSSCSCWPNSVPDCVPLPNAQWTNATNEALDMLLVLHRLTPILTPTKIFVEMIR